MLKRIFRSSRRRSIPLDPEMSSGINSLSDFNSEEDEEEEPEKDWAENHQGPTILTVDDGEGGITHVRVDRPPETQSLKGSERDCPKEPPHGLGDMLKSEFKGRSLFSVEPSYENLRKRIVSKNGTVHVCRSHVSQRGKRYLSDFYNTMIDLQWRYVLLIFTLSFFGSWFGFAWIWYLIFWIRGDLDEHHLPEFQESSGWTPCVINIYNFNSCFLFSVETQHTIGYGSRYTSEKCPEAIFVMSFQSVVGVMIQACMVGTIFAKMSRPKKRAQTLLFSRNAVVSPKDGHLCLQFRVGNMRNSHLVESHARAILISKRVTTEGEVIPYYQTDLKVGTDMEGEDDDVFFIWPMTINHRIDEDSPFYNMSARDFIKKRFEVIVVLEGIVEPTGMSIQARSSYLPPEILWGHRFANVLTFQEAVNSYVIDYSSFNSVYKVEMPPTSAKHLDEEKKAISEAKSRKETLVSSSRSAAGLIAKYKLQATHVSVPCLPQYRQIVPSSTASTPASSVSLLEGGKNNSSTDRSSVATTTNDANVERFF